MKASREWLEEFSNIDVTTLELADKLTMTGSKVETVEQRGNDIKNVVVGKILEIKKHPDADKLVVTKVDVANEILQIVTGANNIKVGDIVPIAKDGASLPNGVKIKTGKLRGIESCGMMCSVGELNLNLSDYPGQIEHGIMILDKKLEKDLGKDIVEVLNLKEDIIDFEITPNRPDCLSIEGLGREVAITLNKEFKNPRKNIDELKIENKEEIEGLKVSIEAPDLCYRYIARVVKDVKIEEKTEDEMLVYGITFADEIIFGEKINEIDYSKILTYLNVKKEYDKSGIGMTITKVSFENSLTTLTLDDKLIVKFPNEIELEYKMNFLKGIIEKLPAESVGVIDMTKDKPIFSSF